MNTWTQVYDPFGNIWISAAVALIPIIFFFLALAIFRMKGYVAGFITVVLTVLVALFAYKMPFTMAMAATGYGFLYGLWPIAWIIIMSVFLYKISVKTGQFDVIRASVLSITNDHRLLVILIGFSFGAFLEGAAGFGAPVAITAALLAGLGLNPLYAAGLCLIANTAPVAFGAMGIPITVAGQVTGIDPHKIGQMAGHQLPFLSLFVPFFIVFLMDGFKGIRQTWPALLVAGSSFAITQFITATFLGPELPDITSALVSLISLALFLKVWQPKEIYQSGQANSEVAATTTAASMPKLTFGKVVKAWSPFIVLTVMVVIWSQSFFKALFAPGGALASLVFKFEIPGLHNLVMKAEPIVNKPTPYEAILKFDVLSATGTAILIACIISMFILKMNVKDAVVTFKETLNELKMPILSIGFVLGFAFIANYSGLSSTLALALAGTGGLFPFFSPFLGWIGVFLTGSDTSANALFSNLQAITAQQVGVSEVLLVAANTTGGVTGKMISPQSIAIACAAVGLAGKESDLFRFTVKHSLFFVIIVGIMTYVQAYYLTWMIP
ncbi:lactate permease (LctP) family transporter [Bacillus cereus BAG1X2-3]|jgi:lactate permease|uniref:L-lactate permease n=3 Tax=Bacillus cereus group TaxID=86661 RepID=A0A9X7EBZ3_BACCE|nr:MULTISPECIES: L-lactate permease [Bacillus]AKR12052.1 L-lactate permease [Bacillus thuringiensis]EOO31420.1 lactate permease (LctP) family transporter [Bacillus cereus BAG1X1-1]EOO45317.1 lactate permease (LctP) family transporter [Bacillus cereus BAG1X2-1]EOO55626.1 lactate permease (LctP) family transporter [Bacillus cereus BAG1X2-2]EOO56799.1 lactate permease (LctP) family transporter [Bacillus cereus BAG1X2-3]